MSEVVWEEMRRVPRWLNEFIICRVGLVTTVPNIRELTSPLRGNTECPKSLYLGCDIDQVPAIPHVAYSHWIHADDRLRTYNTRILNTYILHGNQALKAQDNGWRG